MAPGMNPFTVTLVFIQCVPNIILRKRLGFISLITVSKINSLKINLRKHLCLVMLSTFLQA